MKFLTGDIMIMQEMRMCSMCFMRYARNGHSLFCKA